MISKRKFNELDFVCNQLIDLNNKRNILSNKIIGDEKVIQPTIEWTESITKFNCDEEVIKLRQEAKNIISSLEFETICNLLIVFSIGRLGADYKDPIKSYEMKLEEIKETRLYEDEYYIDDKLIDISEGYLVKYLDEGRKYFRKNLVKKELI